MERLKVAHLKQNQVVLELQLLEIFRRHKFLPKLLWVRTREKRTKLPKPANNVSHCQGGYSCVARGENRVVGDRLSREAPPCPDI